MTNAELAKWLREELPPRFNWRTEHETELYAVITALLALLREGEEASDLVLDDYYCQTSPEEVARWSAWKARLRVVLGEGQ